MFEKEAKERAKDFTDNKERQAAYECGFLDGVDKATEDLKEKLAGAERTRDNLRQIGFPTFQSCKEYADKLNYAKELLARWVSDKPYTVLEQKDLISDTEQFLI